MTIEAQKMELLQAIINIDNIDLLNDLRAMIEIQTSYELSEEQKQILDQRLKTHKENPTSGRTWEEVKAELMSR